MNRRLARNELIPRHGRRESDQAVDPRLVRRLKKALLNLPRRQREIFLACRLGTLTYDEIARRTGLTSRQVEKHFARALYKLDKQMDGQRLSWLERRF